MRYLIVIYSKVNNVLERKNICQGKMHVWCPNFKLWLSYTAKIVTSVSGSTSENQDKKDLFIV